MTNIECSEASLLMCAELDHELEVPNSASLTAHLDQCPQCRSEFDELAATKSSIDVLKNQIIVPDGIDKRILAAVDASRTVRRPLTSRWIYVALAAVLVGLIGISLPMLNRTDNGPSLETLVAETGHAGIFDGTASFKTLDTNLSDFSNVRGVKSGSQTPFQIAGVDTIAGPNGSKIIRTCFHAKGSLVCIDRYEMPKGLLSFKGAATPGLPGKKLMYAKLGAQSIFLMPEETKDVVYASGMPREQFLAWLAQNA